MGTMEEIRYAVDTISRNNKQIVLLHCTTSYPCPKKDANLNAMKTMEDEFGFPVGYSDHTEGIEIPIMAARLGAVVIEKHLTLDKKMKGSDHKSSLNPEELSEMVSAIRNKKRIGIPEYILGTGIKIPTKQELETKDIVRKSLVAAKYIPENTVITQDMIVIKRPGTGIPPKEFGNILGKKTKIPLRKDELISYEVLE
jgi:N-acetylneuraminate synthase/N,N'-diacetyllegionaminate synthase